MMTPQDINPLSTAVQCPQCKDNALCQAALSYGKIRLYVYVSGCGAVIAIPEAPVVGELTKPLPSGGQIMLGLMLLPEAKGVIKPSYLTKGGPEVN